MAGIALEQGRGASDLKLLSQMLFETAEAVNDQDFLQVISHADLQCLEYKLFNKIVYYLLKHLKLDLSGLVWPVLDRKQHNLFIRGVFKLLDQVKVAFPDVQLPAVQKSQLHDPRPESNKVVEFLLELCSLTVRVVTRCVDEIPLEDSLEQKIQQLQNEIVIRTECYKTLEEEMRNLAHKYQNIKPENAKTELVSLGIISIEEELSLENLYQRQIQSEEELFKEIKKLKKPQGD